MQSVQGGALLQQGAPEGALEVPQAAVRADQQGRHQQCCLARAGTQRREAGAGEALVPRAEPGRGAGGDRGAGRAGAQGHHGEGEHMGGRRYVCTVCTVCSTVGTVQ